MESSPRVVGAGFSWTCPSTKADMTVKTEIIVLLPMGSYPCRVDGACTVASRTPVVRQSRRFICDRGPASVRYTSDTQRRLRPLWPVWRPTLICNDRPAVTRGPDAGPRGLRGGQHR